MNAPKVVPDDYIQFLIAAPKAYSAVEAAEAQSGRPDAPAHDAFTRLLTRPEPDPDALWAEARTQVAPGGVLVVDDSTLDKPYATKIDLVAHHWSGKHGAVVKGVNLVTLLWADGDRHVPCDYRLYDRADGLTKNDHFGDMVRAAYARGLRPECVCFDGWYSGLENLKLVRACGWRWLTRLKSNRLVRLDRGEARPLKDTPVSAAGTVVWLPGYGEVRVFGVAARDGGTDHWATGDLGMTDLERVRFADCSWAVESYHRGVKQCTGIERCQCRSARAQRNHVGLAIRAFLRLEVHCFRLGVSWVAAKASIVRDAVRAYLADPWFTLPPPATA